jgi:hypothetical protein
MTKNNIHEKHIVLILIAAMLIVGAVMSVSRYTKQRVPTITSQVSTAPKEPAGGTLTMRKQNDRAITAVGESFDVIVLGDSNKTPILGYDVVINFNKDSVAFKSMKNLDARFEVVETHSDGQLIITGTSLQDTKSITLSDKPLFTLTFTAVKQGDARFKLSLSSKPSQSDSNMIDTKSNDIVTHVENANVFVGDIVSLGQKEVVVDGVTLHVNGVTLPPPGCADCTTLVNLQITKGTDSQRVNFVTGGIAGSVQTSQTVFDTLYEIGEVKANSIIVYYYSNQ